MTLVEIQRIAAGGSGVGRLPNGKTVFVPRTAPGDRVQVDVIREKPRWAEARPVEFDAYGHDRADPLCDHYEPDACGGCQIQHLTYSAQLAVKSKLIGETLRRIGKRNVDDPAVSPAPDPWRYRTKITLAGDPEAGVIGLHRWDVPAVLFEPKECPITKESVMRLWTAMRRVRGLLPPDLVQLVMCEDRAGHLHALIVSDAPWNAKDLASALGDPTVSIWWRASRGAARVLAGPETGFPATAFEQSSATMAHGIRRRAVDFLETAPDGVVWDLYGGLGDTARLIAERGCRVWSVDADRRAHAWARRRPLEAGAGDVHFVTGRVEDVLESLAPPQGLICNPPRVGLLERVAKRLDRLARDGASRMAYVSCDPATLARDLTRLPSWRIVDLLGFDLFPQTSHVETLVLLEAMR